jgi:hypothetical protein
MKTLTENGISTTQANGQEDYVKFSPVHRPNQTFYQYDYRHTDGELFSCVASSLEKCRIKRNTWLSNK